MNPGTQKGGAKPAALGKGLASLLPNANLNASLAAKQVKGNVPPVSPPPVEASLQGKDRIPGITMADIESIIPNQFQPRRDFDDSSLNELAESIVANGIIQPLVVRRGDDGKLNLIAGERRLRAAKKAGLKQLPVVIRKSTDKEALEIALIENIQREDLDVALSYFQLAEDFHLTQDEIAKRVGKDRTSVANHLRLLKLPEAFIQDLRVGKLSFGHGRALLAVADPLKRIEIRNKIIEKQLSVRETEKLVAESLVRPVDEKASEQENEKPVYMELKNFSDRLGRALGTKVKTKGDQYRGSIVIEYFSKEDLDRISGQLLR
jgi:ParB family chromosome partitioning protein